MSAYVFGLTDAVRNDRQLALDKWFKEITVNPLMMMQGHVLKELFAFLDVSAQLKDYKQMLQQAIHAKPHPLECTTVLPSARRNSAGGASTYGNYQGPPNVRPLFCACVHVLTMHVREWLTDLCYRTRGHQRAPLLRE